MLPSLTSLHTCSMEHSAYSEHMLSPHHMANRGNVFSCQAQLLLGMTWRQTEGGHERSKSVFPSVSLNLIYVTASPASYRHCGWFFRPVAVSFCRPELHFLLEEYCFFFFCKPCVLCTKRTQPHTIWRVFEAHCDMVVSEYSLLFQYLETKRDSF